MKNLLSTLFGFFTIICSAQNTENLYRINFISPGIETEIATGQFSTFSTNVGITYIGSYPHLSTSVPPNTLLYSISPFFDIQEKLYYNLDSRAKKGKTTANNTANFVSLRSVAFFKSISSNFDTYSDLNFAVGPTWGFQRSSKKLHFLFDMGPQYYFDTKGNSGFWTIMAQINLGLNLNR